MAGKTYILLLLTITFTTCIKPFDYPEAVTSIRTVVVDGYVTDEDKPATVRLSYTYSPDIPKEEQDVLIRNANVLIRTENSTVVHLTEISPGIYQTNVAEFTGEVGKIYQLEVELPNGKTYQSAPVIMRSTPAVDSLHWSKSTRISDEGKALEGIEVFVTTHDPENNTRYYRWEYEETWEFDTPLFSQYEWTDNGIVVREDPIGKCWTSEKSSNIIISTTQRLSQDIIDSKLLTFVPATNNKLKIKYSILVRQYAMSREGFEFWENMENNNESMGTLFDPQPSMVLGNMKSISDPDEVVLGYFDAYSVSTQRLFVFRGELGIKNISDGYGACNPDTVGLAQIEENIDANKLIIDEVRAPFSGALIGYTMVHKICADCTIRGTAEKPDYWQ